MSAAARRLVGKTEPRVWTPPLRELTPDTTLGFEVIEFAEKALGVTLFEWQKWFLIHALELREDGLFRFRTLVLLVGRQNGKTVVSQMLALYFMYVLGSPKVLGTAQDLDTAESTWLDTLELAQESEVLGPLLARPKFGKGSKEFSFVTGELYRVKTANRRAARGLSKVRLILLDELREQQNWEAWGAISNTMLAEPKAICFALSNAGDATSVVLRYLRMMAHRRLGDPDGICAAADPSALLDHSSADVDAIEVHDDDDSLGLFEWSAAPGCDKYDREQWAQANPCMPNTITERELMAAAVAPGHVFMVENLCQWIDGALDGPFPPGAWDAGQAVEPIVGEVVAGVAVAWDRSHASICYAGRREDGLPHAEVVAYRAGVDWVVDWLSSPGRTVRPTSVAIQPSSPAGVLSDRVRGEGFDVVDLAGADLGQAHGRLYDLVRGDPERGEPCGELRHAPHNVLDVAASCAQPKVFDSGVWVWDLRRSPTDASPLAAMTAAVWLLETKPTPFRSAYENRGLMVV